MPAPGFFAWTVQGKRVCVRRLMRIAGQDGGAPNLLRCRSGSIFGAPMDRLTVERRSWLMGRVRSKDTGPELAVRRLVHGMGYRYRLHDGRLPGKPDLVFSGRRKVVFVHGCFWHGHARCRYARVPKSRAEYWKEKFACNKKRDAAVRRKLRDLGWRALVVWQCELRRPERLVEKLREFLDAD